MIFVFYHSKTDSGIGNLKKMKIILDRIVATHYNRIVATKKER
jgi:hypothetical protein